MSEKSLPWDQTAERATLGGVLVKPSNLDDVAATLKVDDFFLPAHREIFEAMLELDRRRQPIDIIVLAGELKASGTVQKLEGGETYLLTLVNSVSTGENVRHYARIVAEKAVQRRLISVCIEVAAQAQGDFYDVQELLDEARSRIEAIDMPDRNAGPVLIRDDLDGALTEIESRAAHPEQHFVLTGIEAFDREFSGLLAETLILIAARPSRGKSALLFNFALRAAALGIPALVFSLEMSRLLMVFRALAYAAEVNGRSIVSGRLSGPEWVRLQSGASKLSHFPLSIDERENLTHHAIASEVKRWRAKNTGKQAVVLIDYLGMVKKSDSEQKDNEALGAVTTAMKKLAKKLKIPVVVAAQINRESEKENRKPKPSDMRGSGQIEQDADMIIFPWWEGDAPKYGRHPAQLIVGKNRNGATGEVDVDWLPEFTTFSDREDLEQPQQQGFAL